MVLPHNNLLYLLHATSALRAHFESQCTIWLTPRSEFLELEEMLVQYCNVDIWLADGLYKHLDRVFADFDLKAAPWTVNIWDLAWSKLRSYWVIDGRDD